MFQVSAFANSQNGYVENLNVTSSKLGENFTHVKLSGTWSGNPCEGTWWTLDSDTEEGKSFLSVILAAQMAAKEITIWGGSLECHGSMTRVLQVGITQ